MGLFFVGLVGQGLGIFFFLRVLSGACRGTTEVPIGRLSESVTRGFERATPVPILYSVVLAVSEHSTVGIVMALQIVW